MQTPKSKFSEQRIAAEPLQSINSAETESAVNTKRLRTTKISRQILLRIFLQNKYVTNHKLDWTAIILILIIITVATIILQKLNSKSKSFEEKIIQTISTNIIIDQNYISNDNIETLSIINFEGKVIRNYNLQAITIENQNEKKISLPQNNLIPGIYFIRLIGPTNQINFKILIQ